jgi:hypothetical protein
VGDDSGVDEETGGKRRPPSKLVNRAIRRKSLKAQGLVFTEQSITSRCYWFTQRASATSTNLSGDGSGTMAPR